MGGVRGVRPPVERKPGYMCCSGDGSRLRFCDMRDDQRRGGDQGDEQPDAQPQCTAPAPAIGRGVIRPRQSPTARLPRSHRPRASGVHGVSQRTDVSRRPRWTGGGGRDYAADPGAAGGKWPRRSPSVYGQGGITGTVTAPATAGTCPSGTGSGGRASSRWPGTTQLCSNDGRSLRVALAADEADREVKIVRMRPWLSATAQTPTGTFCPNSERLPLAHSIAPPWEPAL